jgi:hypothetical protein
LKTRNTTVATASYLSEQLKVKSRQRRGDLARMSQASIAPSRRRNDSLPILALSYVPLGELRPSKRKLRKLDPAHVREVARSISALGFCDPLLIGAGYDVIHGEIRLEAAKLLGLDCAPCVRVDHLSDQEQRLLRLALNKLGEKGRWDLDELKLEFEELILEDAPIEITGFSISEVDQVVIGDELDAAEVGPLEPEAGAPSVAKLGDMFQLGPHRLICGDATNPAVLARLMEGDDRLARILLTDEPYNVKIAGNVTGGAHREFAMGSGEMSDAEFLSFNTDWLTAALSHVKNDALR